MVDAAPADGSAIIALSEETKGESRTYPLDNMTRVSLDRSAIALTSKYADAYPSEKGDEMSRNT